MLESMAAEDRRRLEHAEAAYMRLPADGRELISRELYVSTYLEGFTYPAKATTP